MTAEQLVKMLSNGGRIVSSNDLTIVEISLARSENRFYVDEDGFGYAYTQTSQCMACEKIIPYKERLVFCGECGT